MFDERSAAAAAAVNPATSATAAALTLAVLNSAAGVGAATTGGGTPFLSTAQNASLTTSPLALQQQQQCQQQITQLLTGKDSRWLQLEVCREYQRGQCTRSEQDCKYAHPLSHVEVQNGRVTACYDSIKGRCSRENPKCKYLHPPQHLKDQLLANGKQNLAMKNLLSQQFTCQQQSIPTLTPFMPQSPLAASLSLHSAPTLPLPCFIPNIYSGQVGAILSGAVDPFSAARACSVGSPMSTPAVLPQNFQHAAAIAQQLALLEQHQNQSSSSATQQPVAAAASLLVSQQQIAQQNQQNLFYLALLQQQQQRQLNHVAALRQTPAAFFGTLNNNTSISTVGRKRGAQILEQQNTGCLEQSMIEGATGLNNCEQQQLVASATAVANDTTSAYLPATNGSSAKRQKTEIDIGNQNIGGSLLNCVTATALCTPGMQPTPASIGLPLYAANQFNHYLIPGAHFLPAVSFSGQLPPRF